MGEREPVASGDHTLDIVILGLSITSSRGNSHATTYRGLARSLIERGHRVLFLEREILRYASRPDIPRLPYGRAETYRDLNDLREKFETDVRNADLVIVGSHVPEGVAVGRWVVRTARGVAAFHDIDTPVTLAKLERNDSEYLFRDLIPSFDLYLSSTDGAALDVLERRYGSRRARPLYGSFDPLLYYPVDIDLRWDLGYLGTYSAARQPVLERLLVEPARRWKAGRFIVAGPLYPESVRWAPNVDCLDHVPPAEHRRFYGSQRFTLNLTRADTVRTGSSPSARLFEAAACGTPIITDSWDGLEAFLRPGEEILVARSAEESLRLVREMPEDERADVAERARQRVLARHTAPHRAHELETYAYEILARRRVDGNGNGAGNANGRGAPHSCGNELNGTVIV